MSADCSDCYEYLERLHSLEEELDALKADYEHEVQARTTEWREAHVDARIKQYRSRAHRAEAERNQLREALERIIANVPYPAWDTARAVLDSELDLVKRCTCTEPPDLPYDDGCPKHGELAAHIRRTRRIKADE